MPGFTLRRLLFGRLIGMVFEGVFTWFMLSLAHVPMAGLLGLLTGVLAFIPNIGAITSGVLMVAVGFSASNNQGLWCILVYFLVHNIDGYVVVPYVARRTVDLAPAVLLAMQLLMGALFGILGILFADPILASIKVVLVDLSHQHAKDEGEGPEVVSAEAYCCGCCRCACCCCCCCICCILLLLEHRRAAGHDLADADVEGQRAVLGPARRWHAVHEGELLGHGEADCPPLCIRVIASANPGKTWSIVNGCGPPWVSLLSKTVPSSVVRM